MGEHHNNSPFVRGNPLSSSRRNSQPFFSSGSGSGSGSSASSHHSRTPSHLAFSALSRTSTGATSISSNPSTPSTPPPNPISSLRHVKTGSSSSGTFAPSFIKEDTTPTTTTTLSTPLFADTHTARTPADPPADAGIESVAGIEGENDFSGKRYVWLKDPENAFVKGWIVEDDLPDQKLLIQCDDGSQRQASADEIDKVNPAKFDKANDMAELTHLNEASVVHNLHVRYQSDLIYTYSGLFLVTVNPYCPLPIYNTEYINMYKGRSREDNKPHIFAMADEAFRNLVDEGENQSILVTGESGAGKTENTKKVIQYLAAVAHTDRGQLTSSHSNHSHSSMSHSGPGYNHQATRRSNLSEQILRANPILEAFGNAQTVRNNNSSRFGKFIRIEFNRTGAILGAFIEWYLLEKSRVVRINSQERNYHIFYQLLNGATTQMKQEFLLENKDIRDFAYTRDGRDVIAGVSDRNEWHDLLEAFHIMGFREEEQISILRTVAAVLHLGNIEVAKESRFADQARLAPDARAQAEKVCKLLGIPVDPFLKGLLNPRVKAGREWVEKVQTPDQVRMSLDALSKGIYERGFGDLVNRINRQLDRTGMGLDESNFIGVLDIAGFEIFEENSFEQLCINYTNEKLQQFFNHHMFVLEQEEYAREKIEWQFIDFGRDLQPTIDLIEVSNPIGVFSCLDEDCVMPKATDKSFTEKLHALWDKKSAKYRASRLGQGFILTHYAAEVEYSTEGWLEKNKDPLNDNITRLLSASTDPHIAHLFADCVEVDEDASSNSHHKNNRVKKGLFRTVAQRHKEQLHTLMTQLNSTHPHFVRCILPNHKKRPKLFRAPLVLDQLRCNGVLEGIRIARTGFPNRLSFVEFRHRYEVLCRDMPKGYVDGQTMTTMMLTKLGLDKSLFRVGLSKVFFRAGVLAELEEKRDALISDIISRFQSLARGYLQRRAVHKRLFRVEATRIVQRNMQVYLQLNSNPWWQLLMKMKPLLGATRTTAEVQKREKKIGELNEKIAQETRVRQKLEEDRRNCHAEIVKIQQTLESERALALDKEEIFKRLQTREAELEEKLAMAIEDQEHMDEQMEALLDAKKEAEAELEKLRAQLEQATTTITRLEEEKTGLAEKSAQLEEELIDVSRRQSERSEQERVLEDEIKMLQSQLSLTKRKMQDLEAKYVQKDQELGVKVMQTEKALQTAKTRAEKLERENKEAQKQLSELASTSTDYEDLVRKKESELVLLRGDKKKLEIDNKSLEEQRKTLAHDKEKTTHRLYEVQAELTSLQSQKARLEREAHDTKQLLEARLSEDAQADENRKQLEAQISELKEELHQTQIDLSRERQSRDDVLLLGEHKYQTLQEEYEHLNESKIIIEKELYVQQDILRRAVEARTTAEQERDEARQEIRRLRVAKTEAEEARIRAEEAGERAASQAARAREESLRKDLEAANDRLRWYEDECNKLNQQVQKLNRAIIESGEFSLKNDQAKERLERELHTVKSRLTASENDNRSLMNKLQQKSLELARTSTRANEQSRSQLANLERDKAKLEAQTQTLNTQLGEAQVRVAGLEKQLEKLQLTVEDLNHEVSREAQNSRHAEKAASNTSVQLAEANRALESERHLRTQAQVASRTMQRTMDFRDKELRDLRAQMLQILRTVAPEEGEAAARLAAEGQAKDDNSGEENSLVQKYDLARRVEELQQQLRVQSAARTNAEQQLAEVRAQQQRDGEGGRGRLEEISLNEVSGYSPRSPRTAKLVNGHRQTASTSSLSHATSAGYSTPVKNRITMDEEGGSRAGTPSGGGKTAVDWKTEVEELQSQMQLAKMQNRQLQSQLDRSSDGLVGEESLLEDSPSLRRMRKLEMANSRLHEMLDDSAKKVSALERTIRSGELSLRDIQTRSHEEILDVFNSQEESRRALLASHKDSIAELTEVKSYLDKLRHDRAAVEVDLRDTRSDLREMTQARDQEAASRSQLLQEYTDLQIRLDAETSKLVDVTANMQLYRSRADEYFERLEQAEIAVLKATRAEQFAKEQAREAEESCVEIMSERKKMDATLEDLQRQTQRLEERLEDMSTDLETALQSKKRLQHELEDYRNQRAMDIEDKESSMEQTRRKYQSEFATLTKELDLAREEKLYKQAEIARLREELDELRSKWDDEVLNSSTWSKEKARMEATLADVMSSRDEAVEAHTEAQGKVVSLLSQVRSLRTSVDEVAAERDGLVREKRSLEARLAEAKAGLEDLASGDSPSLRNAASLDKEILELKSVLAQKEDIAVAAVEKMRRADALVMEVQKDATVERELSTRLQQEKASLEKQLSEVQVRLMDLETKGLSSRASGDVKFLHKRIQELEEQLEAQETERNKSQRSVRNVDRTVKDLQGQIERKEKQNQQLEEDVARMGDKVDKLLQTIDELQASESTSQLTARRAERELREEKERLARLERELENWRALNGQTGPANSLVVPSVGGRGGARGVSGGYRPSVTFSEEESLLDVPKRKSSLTRAPSMTKGFL